MYCENCGTPNLKNYNFCENCGQKFDNSNDMHPITNVQQPILHLHSAATPQLVNTSRPKLSKFSIFLLVESILTIFVVASFYLIGAQLHAPEYVAKQYLTALATKDYVLVNKYHDIGLDKALEQAPVIETPVNIEDVSVISSNDTEASYVYSYTLGDSEEIIAISISLVKADKKSFLIFDQWLINEELQNLPNLPSDSDLDQETVDALTLQGTQIFETILVYGTEYDSSDNNVYVFDRMNITPHRYTLNSLDLFLEKLFLERSLYSHLALSNLDVTIDDYSINQDNILIASLKFTGELHYTSNFIVGAFFGDDESIDSSYSFDGVTIKLANIKDSWHFYSLESVSNLENLNN